MNGEIGGQPNAASGKNGETRQRSSIAFPYTDLSSAIALADAIFQNNAGNDCDDDQLAAWTGQSSKSSTFRVQIYSARTFGLLAGEGPRNKLTELGFSAVDSQRSRAAKAHAFLSVPLYRAVFEKFKGGPLPPAAALEREIVSLGVALKQKDRARQVLERSAEQAGFFEHGKDRLVQPGDSLGSGLQNIAQSDRLKSGGGDGDGGSGLDPVVEALVKKLPRKDMEFSAEARVRWLQMMEMAFQDAYGEVDNIEIKKIIRG